MKQRRSLARTCAAVALASAAWTTLPAQAGIVFNFPDFTGACGSTLTCVGDTAVTAGGALRVTPATGSQAGAGYSTTAITLGAGATFSTAFQFQFTDPGGIDPADGITFVLAAGSSGLGASGGGLGYLGVPNSVAIEFDTYDNGDFDGFSSNAIGVNTNGSLASSPLANPYGRTTCNFGSATFYTAAGCMANGNVWTVTISYDGSLLDVYVQDGAAAVITVIDKHPIDIAGILGTTTAFVGFTSGTGGGWENHDILNWRLANDTSIGPPGPSVPEPGTLALVGLALAGAAAVRRRRR